MGDKVMHRQDADRVPGDGFSSDYLRAVPCQFLNSLLSIRHRNAPVIPRCYTGTSEALHGKDCG